MVSLSPRGTTSQRQFLDPRVRYDAVVLPEDGVTAGHSLGGDFARFTLTIVFYLLCGSVGTVSILLDKTFGLDAFERFLRIVEYVDER